MCLEVVNYTNISKAKLAEFNFESVLHFADFQMQFWRLLQVDGVKRNVPYHFKSTVVVYCLGLHTYIYTGFEFRLSIEGIVSPINL